MSTQHRTKVGWLFLFLAFIYFIILLLFCACPPTWLNQWHRYICCCSREDVLKLNVRGRHEKNTSQLVTFHWSVSAQSRTKARTLVHDSDASVFARWRLQFLFLNCFANVKTTSSGDLVFPRFTYCKYAKHAALPFFMLQQGHCWMISSALKNGNWTDHLFLEIEISVEMGKKCENVRSNLIFFCTFSFLNPPVPFHNWIYHLVSTHRQDTYMKCVTSWYDKYHIKLSTMPVFLPLCPQ